MRQYRTHQSPIEQLEARQMLAGDLSVQLQFSPQGALVPNTQYQAQVLVTNPGTALASVPVAVHLFASPGNTFDPARSTWLGAASIAQAPRFGGVEQRALDFTLPDSIATGSYRLFAMVDPQNIIPEADESNNLSSGIGVTVNAGGGGGGPILVDLTASIALPNNVIIPNTPARATVGIRNAGTGPLPSTGTTVSLYLARGSTPNPATDLLLGSRSIAALAADATDVGDISFTLSPELATGAVRLYAIADPANQIEETNETNNRSSVVQGVGIGGSRDLSGDFVSATVPSELVKGQKPANSTARISVINAGDYPITNGLSTTVRLYLRPVALADDSGDIAVSDAKRVSVGGLGVRASKLVDLSFKPPSSLVIGQYRLIAKIDDGNRIAEYREDNNTVDTGRLFTVVAPTFDPGISSATNSFPATIRAGKSGKVTLNLSNAGNSLFKGGVRFDFTILDSMGSQVGSVISFSKNINVKAGATSKLSGLSIKAPAAPGSYTIMVTMVTADGINGESPVNNTSGAGGFTVG